MTGAVDAVLGVMGNAISAIGGILGIGGSKAHGVIEIIYNPILSLAIWLQSLFTKEYDAWVQGSVDAETGAKGFGDTATAATFAWDRMLNTILPNSLAWLDGRTHQWVDAWIDGTFWPFDKDMYRRWEQQYDWNLREWLWEINWVDPNISDWRNWHAWFDTWPHKMISWVYQWWNDPNSFASWATPVLAWPLVIYYSRPEHRTLRDFLTEVTVDSWVDIPPHVEQAVVNVLLSEGW